jgi:hypothetical protein
VYQVSRARKDIYVINQLSFIKSPLIFKEEEKEATAGTIGQIGACIGWCWC